MTSADPTQFLSEQAVDWPAFQKGHIAQSRMVQMGLNCPAKSVDINFKLFNIDAELTIYFILFSVTGSWFLQTNGKSPFSRGVPGVHYTK